MLSHNVGSRFLRTKPFNIKDAAIGKPIKRSSLSHNVGSRFLRTKPFNIKDAAIGKPIKRSSCYRIM